MTGRIIENMRTARWHLVKPSNREQKDRVVLKIVDATCARYLGGGRVGLSIGAVGIGHLHLNHLYLQRRSCMSIAS